MLETVLQEKIGHIILSYNISLLLHVPLLKIVVERIKCIFTINVGKEECVGFLCLEGEDGKVSGTCSSNIISKFSCF